MLSVIVDAGEDARALPPLLAQLTAGAVEGLVREVLIVAPRTGLVAELCDATGAEAAASFAAAVERARSELLLAAPTQFRFREGWIEALTSWLIGGGRSARVRGLGGVFAPGAVLVERGRAVGCADLRRLRTQLGLGARRIG